MATELDDAATERLDRYFQLIAARHLKDRRKRESFSIYAYGLLGESDRKSVEPLAAQACGDPAGTKRLHDKLLHFVGGSKWDDRAVRQEAAHYVVEALSRRHTMTGRRSQKHLSICSSLLEHRTV